MVDLKKEFKAIQDKVDKLQKVADTQVQPVKQLIKYTDHTKEEYKWSLHSNNSWGTWNLNKEYYFISSSSWSSDKVLKSLTRVNLDTVLAYFDSTVEKWKEDNEETYKLNQGIVKHNQEQYDNIVTMMETVGIKKEYTTYGYKTARSRKMTSTTERSGYIDDLNKRIPRNCGYQTILNQVQNKRSDIESYGKKIIDDNKERIRKEEQERKASELEQKRVKTLAALTVKYDLDYESDVGDVFETIIGRCKYLYLAHYLCKNRGDWSDGYNYAEEGLSGFNIDTEEDQCIYDAVTEVLNKGDIDGRYFRDIDYNYDYLFSLVDKGLKEDYDLLYNLIED